MSIDQSNYNTLQADERDINFPTFEHFLPKNVADINKANTGGDKVLVDDNETSASDDSKVIFIKIIFSLKKLFKAKLFYNKSLSYSTYRKVQFRMCTNSVILIMN